MTKVDFFYLALLINLVIMAVSFYMIKKQKVFKKYNTLFLYYITIFIPLLGFYLVYSGRDK